MPDLRNTQVIDAARELRDYSVEVDVHDPWDNAQKARAEFGLQLVSPQLDSHDGIILTVLHEEYRILGSNRPPEMGRKGYNFLI